jgi:hypothetical protein
MPYSDREADRTVLLSGMPNTSWNMLTQNHTKRSHSATPITVPTLQLAYLLRTRRNIVIVAGAGISTAAGSKYPPSITIICSTSYFIE